MLTREQVVTRLRYQGKQYSSGQASRGGGREVHYLTQAADLIEAQAQRISALELDNRTYINERHENMKRIEELEAELAQLKGRIAVDEDSHL